MSAPIKRVLRRLSQWFLAGVFALLPLVITVIVIAWVTNLLGQILGPNTVLGGLISRLGFRFVDSPVLAYLLGTVVVLAVIFVVGMLIESGGRSFIQPLLDGFFKRIPLIGQLYGTSQQVVALLDHHDQNDLKNMKPVFVQFGGPAGCGFLALLVSGEKYKINGREYQIIIVPTAPVPVGGGMLFVPVDLVENVDLSVGALLSLYVSMGLTAGQLLKS